MRIFNAMNTTVEFYYDDGNGSPQGNPVYTGRFLRTVGLALAKDYEYIPHAGYVNDEVEVGRTHYALDLTKIGDSTDGLLMLADALYFVKVHQHTDDYANYIIFNCSKARGVSWSLSQADSGVLTINVNMICENITIEEVYLYAC